MSRKLVYRDADGEKVTLPNVKDVKKQREFFRVKYRPSLGSDKTTMVRKDRVIRYDV